MAKLLDDTDITYVSFPIVKVEKTDEGDLLVWGKATDGSVDADDQIVDPEWSGKALETWLKTGGNVRVMHSAQHLPAGTGVEVAKGDDDGHWVRSLVVEPTAKRLVEKKVLRAYSVGISQPKIIRDRVAKGGRIVGGVIHELSLVDRPANKNCGITLVKSDRRGGAEAVEELFGDYADLLVTGPSEKFVSAEQRRRYADSGVAMPNGDFPIPDQPHLQSAIGHLGSYTGDKAAAKRHIIARATELHLTSMLPTDWHDDAQKFAYNAARHNWLDREPVYDASPAPLSGTAFLAKRASQDAWSRWDAEGDELGFDGTDAGFAKWLTKAGQQDGQLDDDLVEFRPARLAHKGGAKDCKSCGEPFHADSKLRKCPKCGAKLPKVKVNKGKKGKPFPGAAPPFGGGKHRDEHEHDEHEHDEPDGDEPDGGEDDEPDDDEAPYTVKRMHDATCAAYHWDAVVDEYPSLKSVADAITPAYFRDEVAAAAVKGDMPLVAALAGVAQAADELSKGVVEAGRLADARAHLHKSFTDMYPTQGAISPSTMTPGAFQRPYISAGHAPLNASGGRPSNVPAATHVPDPDDFHRSLITAGHAAGSPANKGDNLDTGGTLASGAARTYYRNASKEAARNAMQAMHDHITTTFPDMCPMAASKSVMPPDMGDTNRPHPVVPPQTGKAPGEVTKTLSKKALKKLLKSTVADATKAVSDAYERKIAALRAEIDELGAQPDPAQAPMRGVVRKAATTDGDEPAPVERISLVEKAQQQAVSERDEEVAYIAANFLHHSNPRLREQGEARLRQLLTT